MTKYLNPQPFSAPVSSGRMTDRQYDIAVGNLILCWRCMEYVKPGHDCPEEPVVYSGVMILPPGVTPPPPSTPKEPK